MPSLDDLLHAAVQGVGGRERPGQVQMAHAVQDAIAKDEHLLVQAGTGTGKSLAYLIPAVMHAVEKRKPAVVATATLALQAQIVDRDMPRLAEAIAPLLGRRPMSGAIDSASLGMSRSTIWACSASVAVATTAGLPTCWACMTAGIR